MLPVGEPSGGWFGPLSLNCFHLVIVLYLLAFELFVPRQGYQLGSLIQGVLSVCFVPVPGVFVMARVA